MPKILLFMGRAIKVRYSIACALAVVWLPALVYAVEPLQQSPLTQATVYYRNEVLAAASVLTVILGAYLSARWRPPLDIPVDVSLNSAATKFTLGIAGGIAAFFYTLNAHNQLTVLHPVWVLGVSFVTPVAIQIAFPILIDVWSKILKMFPFKNKGADEP